MYNEANKNNELKSKDYELFNSQRQLSKALVRAESNLEDCQAALTLAKNDFEYKVQVETKAAKKRERDHYRSIIDDDKKKHKKKQRKDEGIIKDLKAKLIVSLFMPQLAVMI